MSLSKVDISNIALAHIGEEAIRALDEASRRARLCQTAIDISIKAVLGDIDWNFARRLKALNHLSTASVPEGLFAFAIPSDCLVPRELYPRGSRQNWEIVGTSLICPYDPTVNDIQLYYTTAESSLAAFPHSFALAVASYMAFYMSPGLTKDKQLTAALYEQYRIAAADAWHIDANTGNVYKAYDRDPENDAFVNVGD